MRMWMVNPKFLCDRHLLGEHVECHMFVGCILKRKSLAGYVKNGLVEVHNLRNRHDDLAFEMLQRGFEHNSPLPCFTPFSLGKVNIIKSMEDLKSRCYSCKDRM